MNIVIVYVPTNATTNAGKALDVDAFKEAFPVTPVATLAVQVIYLPTSRDSVYVENLYIE